MSRVWFLPKPVEAQWREGRVGGASSDALSPVAEGLVHVILQRIDRMHQLDPFEESFLGRDLGSILSMEPSFADSDRIAQSEQPHVGLLAQLVFDLAVAVGYRIDQRIEGSHGIRCVGV